MAIREVYKDHEITAATWYLPDSARWKPIVTIVETKTGTASAHSFTLSFPTEGEAEREALLFAKKWIDDKKPPL